MITVCIPVYNQRVFPLVNELAKQINQCKEGVDICLIDDASEPDIRDLNRKECGALAKIIELEENVGRAKIRNLFSQHTHNHYLLYLDNDVEISNTDFLRNYIAIIDANDYDVIVGGHRYQEKKPARKYRLRWKYGKSREEILGEIRSINPYKSFLTSNFLIHRRVFDKVKFDESMNGYGHEDTLFGFELKKQELSIYHFDNPVLKKHLDTNSEFLLKTKESISSLKQMLKIANNDPNLISDIKILRLYTKVKHSALFKVFFFFFTLSKGVIRLLLKKGWINSLLLLDFLKLGTLHSLMRDNSAN